MEDKTTEGAEPEQTLTDIFAQMINAGIVFTASDYGKLTQEEKAAFLIASDIVQRLRKTEMQETLINILYPDNTTLRAMGASNRFTALHVKGSN